MFYLTTPTYIQVIVINAYIGFGYTACEGCPEVKHLPGAWSVSYIATGLYPIQNKRNCLFKCDEFIVK